VCAAAALPLANAFRMPLLQQISWRLLLLLMVMMMLMFIIVTEVRRGRRTLYCKKAAYSGLQCPV